MKLYEKFNPYRVFNGLYIPNALARYKNISSSAKMVYGRMLQYAGENGECFPKQSTIAEEVGISEGQVHKIIRELVDERFIEKANPTGIDRLCHKSIRYSFLWHPIYAEPQQNHAPIINDGCGTVANDVSGSITNDGSILIDSYERESDLNVFINKNKEDSFNKESVHQNLQTTIEKVSDESLNKEIEVHEHSNQTMNNSIVKEVTDAQTENNEQMLDKRSKVHDAQEKKRDNSIGKELYSAQSVPKNIESIINLWCASSLINHKPGSKTYSSIVKSIKQLLSGTFFNKTMLNKYHGVKFSEDEIKLAIKNFALAATSPDFAPNLGSYKDYLKKLSMLTFFYNERSEKEKSLFIKYFESKPEMLAGQVRERKDTNPQLTEMIKNVYNSKILGGAVIEIDANMHQKFVLCSQLLSNFFDKNKNKINSVYIQRGNKDKASFLIDSLIHDVGDARKNIISVGWLCSGETFSRRLPVYLFSQGILTGR